MQFPIVIQLILNWSTATESNNIGFEVERKSDKEFVTIGFINGAGNSTEPQKYSYTDNDLEAGRYEYRLKQIDFDGNYDYSNVVDVEINILNSLTLEQNYPNPFNPSTRIKYSIPESGFVNITIYNLLGEKVTELVNEESSAGNHYTDFNAGQLTYWYLYRKTKIW